MTKFNRCKECGLYTEGIGGPFCACPENNPPSYRKLEADNQRLRELLLNVVAPALASMHILHRDNCPRRWENCECDHDDLLWEALAQVRAELEKTT